jgi:hypothetical protein
MSGGQSERDAAMVSISRSMLLAAGLLAFPLAGAIAQQNSSEKGGAAMKSTTQGDTGKSTGPSSASVGDKKTVGSENGGAAMKRTTQGDTGKSTGPSSASAGDKK